MAPFIHKVYFPKHLAEHFGQGDKTKYNLYAISYCRADNPELEIVTIKGKMQDPYEQGFLYAVYKKGSHPKEIQERRNETKRKKGKK